MFLIVTRNFPPDIGGMQILMGGLSESLLNHGPVKVFAYENPNSSSYDNDDKRKLHELVMFREIVELIGDQTGDLCH